MKPKTMEGKDKWTKELYVRFEKFAKRLRKKGKELDANEFWKFLILELFQQREELKKKVEGMKVTRFEDSKLTNTIIDDILTLLEEGKEEK